MSGTLFEVATASGRYINGGCPKARLFDHAATISFVRPTLRHSTILRR